MSPEPKIRNEGEIMEKFGPESDIMPELIKLLPTPITSDHPKEEILSPEPLPNQTDLLTPVITTDLPPPQIKTIPDPPQTHELSIQLPHETPRFNTHEPEILSDRMPEKMAVLPEIWTPAREHEKSIVLPVEPLWEMEISEMKNYDRVAVKMVE